MSFPLTKADIYAIYLCSRRPSLTPRIDCDAERFSLTGIDVCSARVQSLKWGAPLAANQPELTRHHLMCEGN
ncbi:MAG: hypothetical protein RLZZ387_4806 [Chloroflexota bacterium]|jgi:hypothetical protein